jgi:DNA-binding response OmpR family regulator
MARAKRILLVDDDALLCDALKEQFALHQEFALECLSDAQSAIKRAKDEAHIDLVLLDVGLPDMDGREACQMMRRGGFKSPIIMLTGADTDADQVLGLNSGANDYVTKPFKFAVLLARLRAHLRSHEQSEDAVFKIGPYEFRPSVKMLVTEKDKKIRLTEKETSILKYLYRAGGKPITRDVLLDEVWGYNSGVTTHTLETHVYRLRQKIEPDPSNASILVTEGGGYKLAL